MEKESLCPSKLRKAYPNVRWGKNHKVKKIFQSWEQKLLKLNGVRRNGKRTEGQIT
jgi:hypothetical protein